MELAHGLLFALLVGFCLLTEREWDLPRRRILFYFNSLSLKVGVLCLALLVALGPAAAQGAAGVCRHHARDPQPLAAMRLEAPRPVSSLRKAILMTYNMKNVFMSVGKYEVEAIEGGDKAAPTLKRVKKSEGKFKSPEEVRGVQDVLLDVRPDFVVVQEVESLVSLKALVGNRYKAFLLEGNDSRGIDIGFLVRADIKADVEIRTHKSRTWFDPVQQRQVPVFSRDLPVLILRDHAGGKPVLILVGNHGKSKRDRPNDPESRKLRTAQYEEAAEIVKELEKEFGSDVPLALAGDFNTDVVSAPEMNPLRRILKSAFDRARLRVTPEGKRITHSYFPFEGQPKYTQMDDILVNGSLADRIIKTLVYRYRFGDGSERPLPRSYREREKLPSDHYPVWTLLDLS